MENSELQNLPIIVSREQVLKILSDQPIGLIKTPNQIKTLQLIKKLNKRENHNHQFKLLVDDNNKTQTVWMSGNFLFCLKQLTHSRR